MVRVAAKVSRNWLVLKKDEEFRMQQAPAPPSPQDFILAVSQSDQYEIQAATVAQAQSRDQRILTFAHAMVKEHTQMAQALRQAATASGISLPPPSMSSDQSLFISSLQSLRGNEFDKAYARQLVLAHTQAAAVMNTYSSAGTDKNLNQAAKSALPKIRDHLKMAQKLQSDIGE